MLLQPQLILSRVLEEFHSGTMSTRSHAVADCVRRVTETIASVVAHRSTAATQRLESEREYDSIICGSLAQLAFLSGRFTECVDSAGYRRLVSWRARSRLS